MGHTLCYLQSQVVCACQSFRPVAPFLFLAKVPFFAFGIQKGVWSYRYAYSGALMGPTPCYWKSQAVSACQCLRPVTLFFFLAKVPFLAFFF